ncbi:hypothetical protein C7476_13910 [Phyllobacterium bourgognense]|uniref:Uncharacterized protein n=1 Tax=Phyllobacterium bourgognense TaxID=314236 RepID=A0A368YBS6_9HYPH|nr:hypothetical protein C7476_13910 [Phyllobacterium bourgognense]
MTRSRGALSTTMVDRCYPHQVMVKNDSRYRKNLWEISHLATKLGAHALGHHFHFAEEGAHYSVYCFPTRDSRKWAAGWPKLAAAASRYTSPIVVE